MSSKQYSKLSAVDTEKIPWKTVYVDLVLFEDKTVLSIINLTTR